MNKELAVTTVIEHRLKGAKEWLHLKNFFGYPSETVKMVEAWNRLPGHGAEYRIKPAVPEVLGVDVILGGDEVITSIYWEDDCWKIRTMPTRIYGDPSNWNSKKFPNGLMVKGTDKLVPWPARRKSVREAADIYWHNRADELAKELSEAKTRIEVLQRGENYWRNQTLDLRKATQDYFTSYRALVGAISPSGSTSPTDPSESSLSRVAKLTDQESPTFRDGSPRYDKQGNYLGPNNV